METIILDKELTALLGEPCVCQLFYNKEHVQDLPGWYYHKISAIIKGSPKDEQYTVITNLNKTPDVETALKTITEHIKDGRPKATNT